MTSAIPVPIITALVEAGLRESMPLRLLLHLVCLLSIVSARILSNVLWHWCTERGPPGDRPLIKQLKPCYIFKDVAIEFFNFKLVFSICSIYVGPLFLATLTKVLAQCFSRRWWNKRIIPSLCCTASNVFHVFSLMHHTIPPPFYCYPQWRKMRGFGGKLPPPNKKSVGKFELLSDILLPN